jgi:putative zinc finger/helix-turn-helix YgiT family protein
MTIVNPDDMSFTGCPDCGCNDLSETLRNEEFQYGLGGDVVTLSAVVPIICCRECGFEFTDYRAEEVRHETVCRHLGVLSPREIVEVRESIGLTRAEFAALGGFGIASLQRWETGALIQNQANDRLIYLLQFTANRQRLEKKAAPPPPSELTVYGDSSPVQGYVSVIPPHTLSVAVLLADESVRRSAELFSNLMNAGAMFQ